MECSQSTSSGEFEVLTSIVAKDIELISPKKLKLPTSSLTCLDCESIFSTSSKLKYHRLKNHGKWASKTWPCPECPNLPGPSKIAKVFSSQSNLNRHLRNSHQTGPLFKYPQSSSIE